MVDLKNPLLPRSRPISGQAISFASTKNRTPNLPKKTPFRTWIRVEASIGASSCVTVDKVKIVRRCDLPARDLRLLDSLLVYPSTIFDQEKAIVVNLEKIRCIITADELLVSVKGLSSKATEGEEWEYVEVVQIWLASRFDDLPFEFIALEVALQTTSAYLDAYV